MNSVCTLCCDGCKEHGERVERERIIKLLEDDLWHDIRFVTRSPDEEQTNYHDGECLGCRQIALIKGENKPFITAKRAEELTNEMLEE